ncbi:uncharacterized protein LOC117121984 [Anneissia japonica]|uniref:uncharacterized protein LOC117121984 n=1 Tax=Anneissia japonica TaxID=1529436 RepID=UPI001425B41D|nr:uncharacterized protein LOC117121984 [Anneissia japonica]
MADLKETLQTLQNRNMTLYNEGKYGELAEASYSGGCRVMLQGMDTKTGRDFLPGLWEMEKSSGHQKIKHTTVEAGNVDGDTRVYEIGKYQAFTSDGTEDEVGKYLTIWVKEGDQYMIDITCINRSQ